MVRSIAWVLLRLAAAVGVTVLIAVYSWAWLGELGLGHFGFLVWLWFATLGWLVVALQVLGIRADLGDAYYEARSWERDGVVYKRLGVRWIKKFTVGGEYSNRLLRIFRPGFRILHDRASLVRWVDQARGSEAGHVLHALMMLPFMAWSLAASGLLTAACLLVLTILFDLYPVMIQRYNRLRILRALDRPDPPQDIQPRA